MDDFNDLYNDSLKKYEIDYLTALLEEAYLRQSLLLEKVIEKIKIDDNVSKKDTNKKPRV